MKKAFYLPSGLALMLLIIPANVLSQEKKIDELAWLTGSWKSQSEGELVEELWIAPKNGIMLGLNRTILKSEKVFFEYLRIVERDNELVYIASPGGGKGTEFILTTTESKKVIFENLEYDFPQRIMYHLKENGNLIAEVEGKSKGKRKSISWEFKSCK